MAHRNKLPDDFPVAIILPQACGGAMRNFLAVSKGTGVKRPSLGLDCVLPLPLRHWQNQGFDQWHLDRPGDVARKGAL
jgi:hypothetical protein